MFSARVNREERPTDTVAENHRVIAGFHPAEARKSNQAWDKSGHCDSPYWRRYGPTGPGTPSNVEGRVFAHGQDGRGGRGGQCIARTMETVLP